MHSDGAARFRLMGRVCAALVLSAATGGCGLFRTSGTDSGLGRATTAGALRDARRPGALAPKAGVHQVARGETLWRIAQQYGVAVEDLRAANGMSESDVLEAGATLQIPGAAGATPEPTKGVEAFQPVRRGPMPAAKRGFAWPVRGRVVVSFGQKVDGFASSGIVIASAPGRDVVAAKSVQVSFVSPAFEGWGKVVVLQHAGGWHTWYAHLASIAVRPGQTVRRGQTIGKAGRTGRASRTQVAFRILRQGQAVDPKAYLP